MIAPKTLLVRGSRFQSVSKLADTLGRQVFYARGCTAPIGRHESAFMCVDLRRFTLGSSRARTRNVEVGKTETRLPQILHAT